CLLKALMDSRRSLGVEIVAANLDHCLRGKESTRDSKFVKELCGRFGVELVSGKINIKKVKAKDVSTEEEARKRRYDFLKKAAGEKSCNVIATGHTMDDQAETVLLRIMHGASLSGLSGIPPVRIEEGFRIVRPLIRFEKSEILAFLGLSGLGHVEDSSNLDTKFRRNRIRREIIPFLAKYNPKIKRSLANLADSLREDLMYLDVKRRENVDEWRGKDGIKIKDLVSLQASVQREIFKELFRSAGGNIKKLTYRHWMDVDRFIKFSDARKSLDLPGGVKVSRTRDGLVFGKTRY
ncbi:MAG: tRNA lysidine(34) synthetase TilS, partial [Candidatus Omnitrophota bacterium]